jgi:hypothetical protein
MGAADKGLIASIHSQLRNRAKGIWLECRRDSVELDRNQSMAYIETSLTSYLRVMEV